MHPCQNPNCRSFGKPHPNCRCPVDMAEGGEIASYCSTARLHDPSCQFYADGGTVPEGAIPVDQFQSAEDVYGTPGQTAIAGVEGLAKGLAGPAATLAETKLLGVKPEDIRGREEENPIAHGAGVGVGLAAPALITGGESLPLQSNLLAKAGTAAAEQLGVQGVKATAVRLGVENALYALGDEASKAIMGDPSSVQAAAMHVGLAGLIGAGAGIPLGLASKAWSERIAPKAEEFFKDFSDTLKANAADSVATAEEEPIPNLFRPGTSALKRSRFRAEEAPAPDLAEEAEQAAPVSSGSRAAQKLADHLSDLAADAVGSGLGATAGKLTGIPGAGALGAWVGHNSVKPIIRTYLPALIKPILSQDSSIAGLKAAFDTMDAIVSGESALDTAAKGLFAGGAKALAGLYPDKEKLQELDSAIHSLGDNPASMINLGGMLGHYMPAHQTALAQSVQRAVDYLNASRPLPKQPGPLASPVQPTEAEIAAYQRTLGIAQQPLVVIDRIKQGTLTPKDAQDLQNLYPALVPAIMNKVSKHMIDHISTGERVPFKMRRGLSMLMGQDMDGLFNPLSIQAAQATFLPAQPPQMAQAKPPKAKGSPSKLGKSVELAQTPSESRQKALAKA